MGRDSCNWKIWKNLVMLLSNVFLTLCFPWVKTASQHFFFELNWVISGENSRLYHSFKTEDWVGRLSTLAGQCSKNHIEQVVLGRYYMGSLRLHQIILIFFAWCWALFVDQILIFEWLFIPTAKVITTCCIWGVVETCHKGIDIQSWVCVLEKVWAAWNLCWGPLARDLLSVVFGIVFPHNSWEGSKP